MGINPGASGKQITIKLLPALKRRGGFKKGIMKFLILILAIMPILSFAECMLVLPKRDGGSNIVDIADIRTIFPNGKQESYIELKKYPYSRPVLMNYSALLKYIKKACGK